jgi:starch phosphorylase
LFDLLERQIVPLYYERLGGPVPRRWVARVKGSLASLGPFVNASRMVRDYTEQLYEPTARHAERLTGDGLGRARELAAWKARFVAGWHGVHVDNVEIDVMGTQLGDTRTVTAVVSVGELSPGDLEVQLVHGPVGPQGELEHPEVETMTLATEIDDAHGSYVGRFTCERTGRYGYTVRVVPNHPDLVSPAELGHMAFA